MFVLFLISCGAVQCSVRFTVLLRPCYLPSWNLSDDHNLIYITTKQKRYQENNSLHFNKQLERFLYELNLYTVYCKISKWKNVSLRVFVSILVSWLQTQSSSRLANCM